MEKEEKIQPKISVIVPVYKVEKYINKCVESIIQQTYHNLEIILIDDGSPDQCGEFCDMWMKRDERIRVIHKKNGGLSDARNCGIENAAGEYLNFVDSDDYIEPEMLEKLYDAIKRTEADIAVCNYVYEYENNVNPVSFRKNYQIVREMNLSCQEFFKLMEKGKYTFCEVVWNKLYKREVFKNIRYPVGKIHEDEYVFHRIVYSCQKIVCIPYVGYHYLQRGGSIMAENANKNDMIEAIMDRCNFFMEQNEQELATLSESRLLSIMKKVKKDKIAKEDKWLLKEYMGIVWKLYQKRWISYIVLCKRIVRFYLF